MNYFGQGAGNGHDGGEALPDEMRDAVATISTRLDGNLQALGTHIDASQSSQREAMDELERILGNWGLRIQEHIRGVESRAGSAGQRADEAGQQVQALQEALQQELQGLHEAVRNLPQQIQAAQQQFEAVQQQFEATQQRIGDLDRGASDHFQRIEALSGTVQEESERRSHIEVSIGTMATETGRIGGIEKSVAALTQNVADMESQLARTRTRTRAMMSFLMLLAAGSVGLHFAGGWQVLAGYVPWMGG